jgi:hypothetical protein
MPKEKTMTLLHEALSSAHTATDDLVERLGRIYRDEEKPESTEQVVALGFLTCARALRQASLVQEVAIREEIQDLGRLIDQVLVELRRTEQTVRNQLAPRKQQTRSLESDLRPSQAQPSP